jgi:glycosyltransferase involved in cell wall biosynthesis
MSKISYLISTYKAERFMDRRLRNLLCEQNEKDIEVVVVDSASPEDERGIVEKWEAMFPDRVQYIRQDERTPYGVSWLVGWQYANGLFVCNANTDDLCDPDHAGKVFSAFYSSFLRNKNIAFCYTGIHVINELGKTLGMGQRPPFDRDVMSYECHAGPCVAWFNREDFKKKLNWNLLQKRAYELQSAYDFWLWLYFMSLGYDGLAIPDILTIYTQRPDSIENSNKWANNWETYAAISEFFPHHFSGKLKHASEFSDFKQLPPKDEWVATMTSGKKWKNSIRG